MSNGLQQIIITKSVYFFGEFLLERIIVESFQELFQSQAENHTFIE